MASGLRLAGARASAKSQSGHLAQRQESLRQLYPAPALVLHQLSERPLPFRSLCTTIAGADAVSAVPSHSTALGAAVPTGDLGAAGPGCHPSLSGDSLCSPGANASPWWAAVGAQRLKVRARAGGPAPQHSKLCPSGACSCQDGVGFSPGSLGKDGVRSGLRAEPGSSPRAWWTDPAQACQCPRRRVLSSPFQRPIGNLHPSPKQTRLG